MERPRTTAQAWITNSRHNSDTVCTLDFLLKLDLLLKPVAERIFKFENNSSF